jgi:hypothetical protein
VVAPSFLHVGGSSCYLVAAISCADFCGWIDGTQRQSMISVGEVTAEEEREKFLCTHPKSNRRSLALETRIWYHKTIASALRACCIHGAAVAIVPTILPALCHALSVCHHYYSYLVGRVVCMAGDLLIKLATVHVFLFKAGVLPALLVVGQII